MAGGPGPIGPQKGLGKAVRHLREEAKLAPEALAERAGLSASQLSAIEAGEDDPVWGDMRRVAAGLEVSMERLAELAEKFEED
ncbi:MAG TPA: helix-turn-helix transcriptional regulator [Solirubrobacterales bacterium]|nr:helix-turn-helix transcriptional regulator [Solirubrobacterales bacterium]